VLMTPGFREPVAELVRRAGFGKVTQIVDGGASRTESTWRALQALGERECNVLLHDAVRPLLEPQIITACVRALETHTAVEVAIASSDTVLVAGPGPDGEIVRDVLDRSWLRRAQTPQGFRLSLIRRAYELALADPGFDRRPATDDCGVVLRYLPEVPIFLVPGSERNMKVTHPIDVSIAERLLRQAGPPAPRPADYRRALDGRTLVIFGDDPELARLATGHGARVVSVSREAARVEEFGTVAKALAAVGAVDYVVNVPGTPRDGELAGVTDESVAETVAVHYLGALNVARAAHPHLRESGGRLMLRTAAAGASLYSSARAAVAELARTLAGEWAADGVRVTCVQAPAQEALDVLVSGLTGQVIE